MRVRSSLLSLTKGFSLLELILCIGILGILVFMAMPKVSSLSQKECLYLLRTKLLKAQDELFFLYSEALLNHSPPKSPQNILNALAQKKNPQCYFQVKPSQIIAFVYGKKLIFTLSPQDFSYKPKIYCSLSSSICRDFWGKELKK
ncbi:prepilin-type N-terminal cleavage/methylation domain-containing protein [Helicobacter cholecystus]|uniref:Prepilin-type N-terminal cleavage/methylation domain-containing protein n=2 Tax=Helicobacter cholecystus TaxID=45498 RepID=A0A3D8IZB8_9HELI|nr:prepilin-type N-terminal cleavage/methylation domain-containing protein [Helicobacter cholecystus]RDU69901.1 prepilin-type N-terminal cleavage/methylation domain-containing protein [Helicobacter cholecystus]